MKQNQAAALNMGSLPNNLQSLLKTQSSNTTAKPNSAPTVLCKCHCKHSQETQLQQCVFDCHKYTPDFIKNCMPKHTQLGLLVVQQIGESAPGITIVNAWCSPSACNYRGRRMACNLQ